jgi:hypothetical protein
VAARRVVRIIAASRRLRRAALVSTVLVVVAVGLSVCLGVIMLDDVVISRSADLGRLDTQRKELRTENAEMSAKTAQLSAPPLVMRLAEKHLGMVPSPTVGKFIYLYPADIPASPVRHHRRRHRRALGLLGSGATGTGTGASSSSVPGGGG